MGFTGWGVSSGVSAQDPKQTELLGVLNVALLGTAGT